MKASIVLKHGGKWDVRIDLQEGFILDGIYMFLNRRRLFEWFKNFRLLSHGCDTEERR
jgi:hypothetical protein